MSKYNKGSEKEIELLNRVRQTYPEHKPLNDNKVTVDFLFAYGKENADGTIKDAIKVHGVRALGYAKTVGIKERTLGHSDALIVVDGDWWSTSGEEEHLALLDHELYHFEVRRGEDFEVLRDDAGRPKLKMRPHDYEFGWFKTIAKRHGTHSAERIQFKRLCEEAGQYFWPEQFENSPGNPIKIDVHK